MHARFVPVAHFKGTSEKLLSLWSNKHADTKQRQRKDFSEQPSSATRACGGGEGCFSESLKIRWNAFWAEEGETLHLSIFRLLWAALHAEFAVTQLRWAMLERMLPPLPYPFFALFAKIPAPLFIFLTHIHLLGAVLLLCGWHTRMLQILLALSAAILFFHSASTYQNHYAFFLLVSLAMTLMPSERFYSLDARRTAQRNPATFPHWQQRSCSLFAQKLILMMAGFLYAFAGLSKFDPSWFLRWSTTPELLVIAPGGPLTSIWSTLLAEHLAWIPLLLVALLFLTLPFLLIFAHSVPLLTLTIWGLTHLTLEIALPVMQFTPMMLAILLLVTFPSKKPNRGTP